MQPALSSSRRSAAALLAFAAALGVLAASAARADVRFCNRTGSTVSVAFANGQMDPPGVSTGGHLGVHVEGWWKLTPAECARVSTVDASNHWLYYFAHAGSRRWDGNSLLCVSDRRFENGQQFSRAGDRCPNARLEGFRRFESRTRNFTMNLD